MDSTFIGRYLPQRFSDRDGACQRGYYVGSVGVSTGNTLVAAVSGKCIFVPSLVVAPNNTGRAYVIFMSNTTNQLAVRCPLPTDPMPSVIFPFNEAGWICTAVGEAVKADVAVDTAIISFPYFIFTP